MRELSRGIALFTIVVFVAGCGRVYHRERRTPLGVSTGASQVSADPNGFAARGAVAADGTVSFQVSSGCRSVTAIKQRTRVERLETRTWRSGRGGDPKKVFKIVGPSLGALGGLLFLLGTGLDNLVLQVVGGTYTVVGLSLLLTSVIIPKRGTKVVRSRIISEHKPPRVRPIACPAHINPGPPPAQVSVVSPFMRATAQVGPDGIARVRPNWAAAQLDATSPNTRRQLQKGWFVSSGPRRVAWHPTPLDIDMMVKAIGRATGNDIPVVRGGPPPLLEVVKLEVVGGVLVPGGSSEVRLTMRNNGQGVGYRITATTRSGDPALHGLRFVMGSLRPGVTRTRSLRVKVPAGHRGGEALVVLRFQEANNNAPGQVARRLRIRAGKRPALSLSCRVKRGVQRSGNTYMADAGAGILVRCSLRNVGTSVARRAVVTARLSSTQPKRSRPQDLPAGGAIKHDFIIRVPDRAKTGQRYSLTLDARETSMNAFTRQLFQIEVGSQRICTPPISRATYNRRLAKLRADYRAGLLDKKDFEKYETQLVGCLR